MLDLTVSAPPAVPVATAASVLTRFQVMITRSLRWTLRNVEGLVPSITMPVALLLVFTYLFGGAINTGQPEYITYVLPGILLLCASYGASFTAVAVCQDMTGGIVDRFRSMDVSGIPMLTGHVVASVVRNLLATSLAFGVAFAIGFRPEADGLQWLGVLGMMVLFIVAVTWVSATVGMFTKSVEAASSFGFILMFIPYASSAFVPVKTMPSWLQGFAENQPITPVTETLRGLLLDRPLGNTPLVAVIWCLGILLVCVTASALLFRARTSD